MHESGTFAKDTSTLSDHEERVILSARAEMASRACDSPRLAVILETLFLKDAEHTPSELNRRLDESAVPHEALAGRGPRGERTAGARRTA